MKKLILFVTIIFFIGTSCQKKYDAEADKRSLVRLTAEDWDANFLSGNYEANVDFYTENAIRIDDVKEYRGKEAMRALFKTNSERYTILRQKNKVEDTWISGDRAAVRGSFLGSFIHKESGDTLNIKGAWVDVCERQADGSWKMVFTLASGLKD
jgi:ketosteroid isomerase-like protein